MAKDKENKTLEEIRERVRKAAARRKEKPVEQNIPSWLEEAGGRARLNKPKALEGLKGSAKQNIPSDMMIAVDQAKKADISGVAKKTQKDIDALKERVKKAAANKKTKPQKMPSIMQEIAAKTGKPAGAALTVTEKSVTITTPKKKEEDKKAPAKKTETKKKETASKKESTFKEAFAAARKAGNKEFTWNGKKYAAVTKAEVEKSGAKSLQEYLNKKAGKAAKGMYVTKNRTGAHDYRQGGMLLGVQDRRKIK